jgi:hypothetical protein
MTDEERRAYSRARYAVTKELTRQRRRAQARRRLMTQRAFIRSLKQHPCVDCHQTFPTACMHFDHVRGKKIGGVSILVSDGVSRERLLTELAKCELVCANCHAIRTEMRRARPS